VKPNLVFFFFFPSVFKINETSAICVRHITSLLYDPLHTDVSATVNTALVGVAYLSFSLSHRCTGIVDVFLKAIPIELAPLAFWLFQNLIVFSLIGMWVTFSPYWTIDRWDNRVFVWSAFYAPFSYYGSLLFSHFHRDYEGSLENAMTVLPDSSF